jgi:hypothetical protein
MSQVRVRMYRPGGIGDCFLLSFRNGDGPHMLIDCGILKGTPGGAEGLKKAIKNVAEVTQGKLDILVVTHEHWDHVSGFLQAQDEFQQLTIGEVWLAWTEERGNELADRLRSQKDKAKRAVAEASLKLRGLMGTDKQAAASLGALEKLSLFYADQDQASLGLGSAAATDTPPSAVDELAPESASSSYSTASAMDWTRLETGGRVRYLTPGGETIPIPGLEDVRVFVLGPPQSETWIKKENPSKKEPEVYSLSSGINLGFLSAVGGLGGVDGMKPFNPSFELEFERARQEIFIQQSYFLEEEQWRQIELDWLWTAERLALQLDSDTNNTSLALAIELASSGNVLIFPGDAQVGNWLSWQEPEWTVKNSDGFLEKVKVEGLLKRTVLYKVGHHASHNATLRWGLEAMAGEGMSALIPVYEAQAREQGKKGWDMPFGPLLKRLQEKTEGRVFRADLGAPEGWETQVAGKYEVTEGWVDVWLEESK